MKLTKKWSKKKVVIVTVIAIILILFFGSRVINSIKIKMEEEIRQIGEDGYDNKNIVMICESGGGGPFHDYEDFCSGVKYVVYRDKKIERSEIYNKSMPKVEKRELTNEQMDKLKEWIDSVLEGRIDIKIRSVPTDVSPTKYTFYNEKGEKIRSYSTFESTEFDNIIK